MEARGDAAAAQLAYVVWCYFGSSLEQCNRLSEILTPELVQMAWKGGWMFFGLFSTLVSNEAELELLQPCSHVIQVSGAEVGKLGLCF